MRLAGPEPIGSNPEAPLSPRAFHFFAMAAPCGRPPAVAVAAAPRQAPAPGLALRHPPQQGLFAGIDVSDFAYAPSSTFTRSEAPSLFHCSTPCGHAIALPSSRGRGLAAAPATDCANNMHGLSARKDRLASRQRSRSTIHDTAGRDVLSSRWPRSTPGRARHTLHRLGSSPRSPLCELGYFIAMYYPFIGCIFAQRASFRRVDRLASHARQWTLHCNGRFAELTAKLH